MSVYSVQMIVFSWIIKRLISIESGIKYLRLTWIMAWNCLRSSSFLKPKPYTLQGSGVFNWTNFDEVQATIVAACNGISSDYGWSMLTESPEEGAEKNFPHFLSICLHQKRVHFVLQQQRLGQFFYQRLVAKTRTRKLRYKCSKKRLTFPLSTSTLKTWQVLAHFLLIFGTSELKISFVLL